MCSGYIGVMLRVNLGNIGVVLGYIRGMFGLYWIILGLYWGCIKAILGLFALACC